MTTNEAIAKLQAAIDIATSTRCELAKLPAKDTLEIVELLKEQEPHLLNIDEVKDIAYEESYRIRSVDCNPVWLERRDDAFTGLQLALISWMYEPDNGYTPEDYDFYSKHFGSDIWGVLPYKQFGKTWRVWNKLPTMRQRKVAKWVE